MTETQIRYALERAAEDVRPPPDLLDRVRAGGKRRVVRRRTVLAGGLAVVAAGAAVPLSRRRPAERDWTGPTRGDLAAEWFVLAEVLSAWRAGLRAFDTTGKPHVHWAGRTSAGPVALVGQAAALPGGPGQDLLGFVEPVDGGLRCVNDLRIVPSGTVETNALLAGAQRDVLVVVDAGLRIELARNYDFDAAGRVRRAFEPIGPVADGVRVLPVGPQAGDVRIALRQGDEVVSLANAGEVVPEGADNQVPQRITRNLPGREAAWPADAELPSSELDRWNVTSRSGYDDRYGYHAVPFGASTWFIRGATPDGRRLVVQTLETDGRSRVFWLIGPAGAPPQPHYAGMLTAPLATGITGQVVLHVRLPQGQGVVVSALNASLRYRAGGGSWLPASGDTALLPAAATDLEVRPRGGNPVPIRLP